MKTFQLATVSSPSLIVECGGEMVQTAVIKNFKKHPNFPGSVLLLKVVFTIYLLYLWRKLGGAVEKNNSLYKGESKKTKKNKM